jgi:hypothetical protein
MASPNVWPGGLNLAGTVFQNGPSFLQASPTWLSGSVQWVNTIGGNNANAGTNPELPVATLAQAVTNSAVDGVIIIGEGSSETVTLSQTFGASGIRIFGCGTGAARPRYAAGAAINMFSTAGQSSIKFNNLYFPASTAASTTRILVQSSFCEVNDCYFECGANDTGSAVKVTTSNAPRITGSTFISTASRPAIGLELGNASTASAVVKDCVFDGGSFGWTDYAFKISAAATRTTVEGVQMLRRSDFGVTVTGTSYQLFGLSVDGTGQVLITA